MFKSFANLTQEIFDEIVLVIQTFFSSYNPDFNKKTVEKAISESHAKELWNAGLLNEKIRRQNNPLTADSITKVPYGTLEEWGIAKIGRKPFVEGRGEYRVQFEGTGGIYEAGNSFINTNTGFSYTLKERVVVNEGSGADRVNFSSTLNFNATNARFASSNETGISEGVVISDIGGIPAALKPGNLISSTQILAGINNPSLVTEVIVEPTESESITEYKEDVLQAYRISPRGGARGDYVLWAEEVSGVKRVYPYAGDNDDLLGAAWIVIESTIGDGIASPELIDAIIRKIDSKIALSDCGIVFESVIVSKFTVFIEGLYGIDPDDLNTVQNDILSTVENYFKSIKPFIDGVDRSTAKNDTLRRVELVSIIFDTVAIYGGIINDAYWNISERDREVEQNEIFRVSNIIYI